MSSDPRASGLPPPRFPKRGFELLVDHDGRGFQYFVPDSTRGPGFFHPLRAEEVEDLFARVLLRRDPTLPVLILVVALVALALAMGWTGAGLALLLLGALGIPWLAVSSRKARSLRIWFNQERPEIAARFAAIQKIAETLEACQKVWMVLSEVPGSAGTPCGLRSADVGRVASAPPGLRISSPKGRYYLLPGGILAWRRGVVSFGPYEAWHNRSGTLEMVFPGSLPRDSPQKGQRHLHVTRQGRPDPKFGKNPVLPLLEVGELVWGLGRSEMHLRTSRPEAAAQVARELRALAGQESLGVRMSPSPSGESG